MSFNPYLEVAIAAALFGAGGVFVKLLHLPATSLSLFRVAVPAIALSIYFIYKQKNVLKSASKTVVLFSFVNTLRLFLWLLAYVYTSVGNAVLILYTWPIFTVLLSPFFLKEKLTKKKLTLVVLAFMGVVIMFANKEFSFSNKDFVGMLAMLGAAVLSAFTALFGKKLVDHYSSMELIFYQNFLGAIIFLPFIFINKPVPTLPQIAMVSIYSFLAGFVAFVFWFSALKKISASTVATIGYVEVLSAILLGTVVLKEGITLNMLVGGGIILVVSYLARKTEPTVIVE